MCYDIYEYRYFLLNLSFDRDYDMQFSTNVKLFLISVVTTHIRYTSQIEYLQTGVWRVCPLGKDYLAKGR